jgi:ATP-dependent DNA helicase 2 subunit 1
MRSADVPNSAPKTATKRVFLVTNVDDPHPGPRAARFKTTARTTLDDLAAAGAQVEPFFIAPFDISKFYAVSTPA